MMRIVIHPGAPKCATTFLQEKVLAQQSDWLSVGRPFHKNEAYQKLRLALVWEENQANAKRVISEFFDQARSSAEAQSKRAVVLSDETLSAAPLLSVTATRLREAVGPCEVLLTLRNQFTALLSLYAGHGTVLKNVPASHVGKFVPFEEWLSFTLSGPNRGAAKRLNYNNLYAQFANVFGEQHVHVLLYEQLVQSRDAFLEQLAAVLSCGELTFVDDQRLKVAPTARMLRYKQFRQWFLPNAGLTRFVPRGLEEPLRSLLNSGERFRPKLSAQQEMLIRETFAEGNRNLSARLGGELEAYDYPL